MKTLNERQVQLHVPIVAWLLIVTNGLLALGYLFVMSVTMVAPAHLLTRALAFPALMFVLAIPGLIAGFGLRGRKAWARILGIVGVVLEVVGLAYAYALGNMGLLVLVFGILVGIYAIFVLMQEAATGYLASPKRRPETAPRHA